MKITVKVTPSNYRAIFINFNDETSIGDWVRVQEQ